VRRSILPAVLVAAFVLPGHVPSGPPSAPPRPNLILISIDTLRADRVGCYGYDRETTPTLDRLAKKGVRFTDVLTQATHTTESHQAIFTGALPSMLYDAYPKFETLGERFHTLGYDTAAFVDSGFMRKRYGHNRGFDLYEDEPPDAAPDRKTFWSSETRGLAWVLPRAEEWLRRREERPFFLFLHTYDVHCPYTPPGKFGSVFTGGREAPIDLAGMCSAKISETERSPEEVAWIRDQYDGGVRYTDHSLGKFLDRLKAAELDGNTVIVVISDHGESLGEVRGWFGHNRLFESQLYVPWIMSGPTLPAGVEVTEPAQLVDLVPTIYDLFDLEPLSSSAGRSLMPAVHGKRVFGEERLRVVEARTRRGLVRGEWMLVETIASGNATALHRLDEQPRRDRLEEEPEIAGRLLAEWRREMARLKISRRKLPEEELPVDDAVLEELRKLGYVD